MSNSPEFQLCYDFWFEFDILGLMTWDISNNEIKIVFYYNDENVDVEIMPYRLNKTVGNRPALLPRGWRPNFKMVISKFEPWITDFYKKIIFVMRN